MSVIVLVGRDHGLPTFFVPGEGGTLLRQLVLGSSLSMFALAAAALLYRRSSRASTFGDWYGLALTLVAIGLLGVLLERNVASSLGWVGRGAQFLSGVYMVLAAVAALRESKVLAVSLEASLRESDERFRTLVELAPDAVLVHQDRKIVFANAAGLRLYAAQSPEQILGKDIVELVHPDDRASASSRVGIAQGGERTALREFRLLTLDGREIPAEASGVGVHYRGRPAGGSTRVSVAVEGNAAVVRVADDGVGMAGETVAGLFRPFMQADHTLDRSKGGLGLGLALVKGLVELHGGSVSAHSEGLGKGTEFVVRLPLDTGVALESQATRLHPPKARRRILIIEDNIDAADSLREALELSDHEVVTAHDGPEGLANARMLQPEVVLCDIGLPGMDGFEVARAFRADEGLNGAFLVALSGYALAEDLQRASEAGFERHLAKPPSMERLEQLLAEVPQRVAGTPVPSPCA